MKIERHDEGACLMAIFLEYQDALPHLQENQLPFFINKNTISRSAPLHHHDFMELSFVYEGHGFEKVNGKNHPMCPGTVSILLPHHMHEIHCESETPIRLYCCMFDMKILFESSFDTILGNFLLKTGTNLPSYYALNAELSLQIRHTMEEMYTEHHSSSFAKNTYIRAKLIEVLAIIIRTHSTYQQEMIHFQNISNSKASLKILEIVRHLHLYYREPLSLKTLSEKFSISIPYISRLFNEQTGQNFIDYLHTLRIKRALTLLVTTNMSIHEIASDVGFEYVRTFSRVFKETIGMSAREYRNHKRKSLGLANENIPSNA